MIVIDIEGKVKAIIYEKLSKRNVFLAPVRSFFGNDEKAITLQSNLKKDLGADSLDMVELVMDFEKEFNIVIPDEEAEKISTVVEAIEYVRKNMEQTV